MATAQDVIALLRRLQAEEQAEAAASAAEVDAEAAAAEAAVEAALAAEDAPHEPFASQSREARELYLDREITILDAPPSPLEFYRDYVARNRPVLIRNTLGHWPALHRWPEANYLREQVGGAVVTVDRVPVDERFGRPLGFGDAVLPPGYFVTPSEERMRLADFLDVLEGKSDTDGVLYAQHQNSSLTDPGEFASLAADAPEIEWVSEAFGGAPPDATNLWLGSSRSVSTLHHDPYENLYAVVQGRKMFLLYPPSDFYFLDKREYPKCKWHYQPPTAGAAAAASAPAASASSSASSSSATIKPAVGGRFTLLPDPEGARTAWFDLEPQGVDGCVELPERQADGSGGVDAALAAAIAPVATPPLTPHSTLPLPPPGPFPPYASHPRISASLRRRHTNPLWVEVEAGELLYLPSLWFHRVAQEEDPEAKRAVAVNFWYDMAFDSRYTSFRLAEQLAQERREQIAQRIQEKNEKKTQQKEAAATAATAAVTQLAADSTQAAAASAATPSSAGASASDAPQPPVLLLLLCGLPASGKSSLCRALVAHAVPALEAQGVPAGTEVHHICFDDVYRRLRDRRAAMEAEAKGQVTVEDETGGPAAAPAPRFDPQLWKLSHRVALQWAEAIVARARATGATGITSAPPQLLLLDDNFLLRSMRRRAYQLARRARTAFLQLHVSCGVETAVRRNAQREEMAQRARDSGEEEQPQPFPLSDADEADLERLVTAALAGAPHSDEDAADDATESAHFPVEEHAVSEATIRRMAAAFQPPPTSDAVAVPASAAAAGGVDTAASAATVHEGQNWERSAVRFDTDRLTSLVAPVRRMAQALLGPPLPAPPSEEELVEEARQAVLRRTEGQQHNAASLLHQIDLRTRSALADRIAQVKSASATASAEQAPDSPPLAQLSQQWNDARRTLLANVKQAGTEEHALCVAAQSDAEAVEQLLQRFQALMHA